MNRRSDLKRSPLQSRGVPLRRTRMKPGRPSKTPMPKSVADAVIDRAGGRCEACGFAAVGKMSLHHRKMRSQGGQHTVENLLYVHDGETDDCHAAIHRYPRAAYLCGLLVRSWLDPADIPVKNFGSTIWA